MGTVRAELSFPLENRGEDWPAIARAVEETALALGIAHLLDRPNSPRCGVGGINLRACWTRKTSGEV